MSNEPYDFGRLYFLIAAPLFLSGLLGLFNGALSLPFFIVLLVSLFIILRVVNVMSRYDQATHSKRGRR